MYKNVYRLKKKYQFNYVYRVGKTTSGKFMVLYYCPSKNKNVKVGISVSKKLGHAVVRNRTKRRLRECITPHLTKISPNYNLVIVAKQSAADAPFNSLNQELHYLLTKSKLFKDGSNEKITKNSNKPA